MHRHTEARAHTVVLFSFERCYPLFYDFVDT